MHPVRIHRIPFSGSARRAKCRARNQNSGVIPVRCLRVHNQQYPVHVYPLSISLVSQIKQYLCGPSSVFRPRILS